MLDPGGWAPSEGEDVHFLQERVEVVAGGERARMEIAECLVPPLQPLRCRGSAAARSPLVCRLPDLYRPPLKLHFLQTKDLKLHLTIDYRFSLRKATYRLPRAMVHALAANSSTALGSVKYSIRASLCTPPRPSTPGPPPKDLGRFFKISKNGPTKINGRGSLSLLVLLLGWHPTVSTR